jgi:hypothetical protein
LAWTILFIALIAPVFVGSALGGKFLADLLHAPLLSPVIHAEVWIGGVLLVTWFVRVKLNRAPWSGMALPRPQLGRLALGAFAGASAILAAFAIEAAAGWAQVVHIDLADHRGAPKAAWIVLALLPSLAVGLAEELSFRGYIFQTLGERTPVWIAALLTGIIFGVLHFSLSGFGVSFVLSVIVISTMFIALRFATGSLWFPIGFHGAWDWTQTYLVGLSTAGAPGYNPALVQVRVSGPALWIGNGFAIEGGLLFILLSSLVLAIALIYAARHGNAPTWNARLSRLGPSWSTKQGSQSASTAA